MNRSAAFNALITVLAKRFDVRCGALSASHVCFTINFKTTYLGSVWHDLNCVQLFAANYESCKPLTILWSDPELFDKSIDFYNSVLTEKNVQCHTIQRLDLVGSPSTIQSWPSVE